MGGSWERFFWDGLDLARVCECFVETGTHRGETALAACRAGFRRVITIETCERLAAIARTYLEGTHAEVHVGSSRDLLLWLCDPEQATLVYLDAHFCGGPRDEQDDHGECPLMAELHALSVLGWKRDPVIVIDDASMFTRDASMGRDDATLSARGFDMAQWPTLDTIRGALPRHTLCDHEDRIYCLPGWLMEVIHAPPR